MQARELMQRDVLMVGPNTPAREIARLLSTHRISAAPVVDSSGEPIGMVSEGDLIGEEEPDRYKRREWWLALLADGETLAPEFLASLGAWESRAARDIMSTPVVTVSETANESEIAGLLTTHRIKRVPVVRDGKIVGIVSRADLVRALAFADSMQMTRANDSRQSGIVASFFGRIDQSFAQVPSGSSGFAQGAAKPQPGPDGVNLDVAEFRKLVADFERQQARRSDEERRASAELRRDMVKRLMDQHLTEQRWRGIMHAAREAAARGEKEFMLLRFPSSLCSDGGRAINALDQDQRWPKTLRGEAAEFYLRWENNLKPHGFRLAAWVLDFPGGFPGDIGLFLIWGE